jgi:hypothetical protein
MNQPCSQRLEDLCCGIGFIVYSNGAHYLVPTRRNLGGARGANAAPIFFQPSNSFGVTELNNSK